MYAFAVALVGLGMFLAGAQAAPQFAITEHGSAPAFVVTDSATVPSEPVPQPVAEAALFETTPLYAFVDCPGGRCLLPAIPRRSVTRHVEHNIIVQQPAAASVVEAPSCAGGGGTHSAHQRRAPLRNGVRGLGSRLFRGRCR